MVTDPGSGRSSRFFSQQLYRPQGWAPTGNNGDNDQTLVLGERLREIHHLPCCPSILRAKAGEQVQSTRPHFKKNAGKTGKETSPGPAEPTG
jgi:hypothetical protein